MFELSNVPRPVVGLQRSDDSRRYLLDLLSQIALVLGDEGRHKKGNVFLARAKRWKLKRDNPEAVVQISAECALVHTVLEVPVGGRDDADVDFACVVGPAPFKLTFLKDTKEL